VIAAEHDSHGETQVRALASSVRRLRAIVEELSEHDLATGAYPSEWSLADVLSHLGSGAIITQRRLEDTLAGSDTPEDHAPSVWEEWNAKTPAQQRHDALEADAALLARLEEVPLEQREAVTFSMGPMSLSFADFVAMRLNEHAFHTWDIEVVSDASATLPVEAAAIVVDNLELVARFTARPTGATHEVTVTTTDPRRGFVIDLTEEGATLRPSDHHAQADLLLPAEAFARLVYGRLDAAHTPALERDDLLEDLRKVFPGP
jgi:uncharacterized protein (TIGR03083 family)